VRILGSFPTRPLAGSTVTANALLAQLEQAGHEIAANWDDADLALVHLDDPIGLARLSRRHQVPVVALVRRPSELARVDPKAVALAVHPSAWSLREARWAGEQLVCRPMILVSEWRARPINPGHGAATLVNLAAGHGARLFYELARQLPAVEFLGVRGAVGAQAPAPRLPNLRVIGPVQDMTQVYARTRLLLMPGRQTYGRPAVEAACSGIPTVAGPDGAARDVLKDAASYRSPERPGDWVAAIRQFADEEYRKLAGRRALTRAVRLDPTGDLHRLAAALESVLAA
jgi:hypothetical protein